MNKKRGIVRFLIVAISLVINLMGVPVMAAEADAALIGAPGRLDGPLAKAVGLSGTYDPDLFTASIGEPFPSIRLELKDTPGAFIYFSNPPLSRYEAPIMQMGKEIGHNFAFRLISSSLFRPTFGVRDVELMKDVEPLRDGMAEIRYRVLIGADEEKLGRDYVLQAENSFLVIRLEYVDDGEEQTVTKLLDGIETILFEQGDRPAVNGAAYDVSLGEISSVAAFIEEVTTFESLLDSEAADLRLNGEWLEQMASALSLDGYMLGVILAGKGGPALSDEQVNEAKEELSVLDEYGIVLADDGEEGDSSITLTLQKGRLFKKFIDVLPTSYAPIIDFIVENEAILAQKPFDLTGEELLSYVKVLTEFSLLIGDEVTWTDPIVREYEMLIPHAFQQFWIQHRNQDGSLSEAGLEALRTYRDYAKAREAELPEGEFARKIGFYAGSVEILLNKIEENGGAALSDEQLNELLQEVFFRNMTR